MEKLNLFYVYIIKCSSFYKIGYSKNPKQRAATIQTHCPLDVNVIATFKTSKFKEIEIELHNLFKHNRTRGEWFELSPEDLLKLKLEYGFTFKHDINKITQDNSFDYNSAELVNKRAYNEQFSNLKQTFESIFNCEITNTSELVFCHNKYGFNFTKIAINDLFEQSYNASSAYKNLRKFTKYAFEIENNSAEFLANVVSSIYINHYKNPLTTSEYSLLLAKMSIIEDAKGFLKKINSQKFYCNGYEFWNKFILS